MLEGPHNNICFSCKHVQHCALRNTDRSESRPNHTIFECEEFDVEPCEKKSRDLAPPERASIGPASNGLCSDCRNRQGCTFSGVEGGVWHCEEYE